jgi:hypothetical protein
MGLQYSGRFSSPSPMEFDCLAYPELWATAEQFGIRELQIDIGLRRQVLDHADEVREIVAGELNLQRVWIFESVKLVSNICSAVKLEADSAH